MSFSSLQTNLDLVRLFEVPAGDTVLWDHKYNGHSTVINLSSLQKPKVIIKEKVLQVVSSLLTSSDYKKKNFCKIYGHLKPEPVKGLCLVLNMCSEDVNCRLTSDINVTVPVVVVKKTSDDFTWDFRQYGNDLKTVYDSCTEKPRINLEDFFRVRIICSCYGIECNVKIEMLCLDSSVTIAPINPVPILQSDLLDFLSNSSTLEPHSGFLSMDFDRQLILVADDTIQLPSIPLVGIWVSGVISVHHPLVWAACLQYVCNTLYEERLCLPPLPFLLVVFNPQKQDPEFFDCICVLYENFPTFSLFTGSSCTTLPKVPVINSKQMSVVLNECKFKPDALETAIQQVERKAVMTSKCKIVSQAEDVPKLSPVPMKVLPNMDFLNGQFADISLLSDSEEQEVTHAVKKSHKRMSRIGTCNNANDYSANAFDKENAFSVKGHQMHHRGANIPNNSVHSNPYFQNRYGDIQGQYPKTFSNENIRPIYNNEQFLSQNGVPFTASHVNTTAYRHNLSNPQQYYMNNHNMYENVSYDFTENHMSNRSHDEDLPRNSPVQTDVSPTTHVSHHTPFVVPKKSCLKKPSMPPFFSYKPTDINYSQSGLDLGATNKGNRTVVEENYSANVQKSQETSTIPADTSDKLAEINSNVIRLLEEHTGAIHSMQIQMSDFFSKQTLLNEKDSITHTSCDDNNNSNTETRTKSPNSMATEIVQNLKDSSVQTIQKPTLEPIIDENHDNVKDQRRLSNSKRKCSPKEYNSNNSRNRHETFESKRSEISNQKLCAKDTHNDVMKQNFEKTQLPLTNSTTTMQKLESLPEEEVYQPPHRSSTDSKIERVSSHSKLPDHESSSHFMKIQETKVKKIMGNCRNKSQALPQDSSGKQCSFSSKNVTISSILQTRSGHDNRSNIGGPLPLRTVEETSTSFTVTASFSNLEFSTYSASMSPEPSIHINMSDIHLDSSSEIRYSGSFASNQHHINVQQRVNRTGVEKCKVQMEEKKTLSCHFQKQVNENVDTSNKENIPAHETCCCKHSKKKHVHFKKKHSETGKSSKVASMQQTSEETTGNPEEKPVVNHKEINTHVNDLLVKYLGRPIDCCADCYQKGHITSHDKTTCNRSVYGLPSDQLTFHTKDYLHKHGLFNREKYELLELAKAVEQT